MKKFYLFIVLCCVGITSAESLDTTVKDVMKWRNIGPFRGGRSLTAVGIPNDPLTYYFGSVGGGIWKTTDGGIVWKNVSDGFLKTGSVGALAVAESDPNIIYAGMGEACIRPSRRPDGRSGISSSVIPRTNRTND